MAKIAVVGSGLSGLVAAQQLAASHEVKIFEKARGVGGRLATRRALPYYFDHGAQFFKARTKAFQSFLQPLLQAEIIAPWFARFVEIDGQHQLSARQWATSPAHYVGVPNMNAVAKYLAAELEVQLQIQIQTLDRRDDGWWLQTEQQSFGPFDWVVVTAPAAQTAALLPNHFAGHQDISAVNMLACFSLMLGFEQPLALEFDAALIKNADISWLSVNHSKPERSSSCCLLVHSTNRWAEQHFELDRDQVSQYLLAELRHVLQQPNLQPDHQAIHGWRYANLAKQSGPKSYVDPELQLAACGDWCIQGRVEAAFLSAMDLMHQLKNELGG